MTVYLVGAGPGDPGLLTVRGAELLARAQVVVHDRLVDSRLLALSPLGAERVDVGKRPGGGESSRAQDAINAMLVDRGRRFDVVVRLKGGDPYVFGRGAEEAAALAEAGVAFEVVPGVTSATAALSYAGIPVTARGVSECFTVVVGHRARSGARGPASSEVDWDALAKLGGTIVVLMGAAHRGEIAARLVAGGLETSTPVAVVSHATVATQASVRSCLGQLGELDVETPATIVIGAVAALDLGWFERRPLFGWRVVVTRGVKQASALADGLRDAGALPVELPTIAIAAPSDGGAALRSAAFRLDRCDWVVFSSANAVEALFAEVSDARTFGRAKVAAVGEATASALSTHGIVADLMPEEYIAESLLGAFPLATDAGGSVMVLRAAGGRDVLPEGLVELGWSVELVEAYQTVRAAPDPEMLAAAQDCDAITFASSSAVTSFLEIAGASSMPPIVACIGPETARTARLAGVAVDVESPVHTASGLVAALADHARSVGKPFVRPAEVGVSAGPRGETGMQK